MMALVVVIMMWAVVEVTAAAAPPQTVAMMVTTHMTNKLREKIEMLRTQTFVLEREYQCFWNPGDVCRPHAYFLGFMCIKRFLTHLYPCTYICVRVITLEYIKCFAV